MKRKLLPACLFGLIPASMSAQAVRGVIVDQLDRPLAGVVVQLTDSSARVLTRSLSNERGEYRLTAPAAGRYRVRTTRIGFRPSTTELISLAATADVTRRLVLTSNPVVLNPVTSTVRTACRVLGLDSTAATFTAWEQVRAAMLAADVTAEMKELMTTTLRYERKENLEGFVVRQTGSVSTALAEPWHSTSVDSLRKVGYVVLLADKESRVFHGPDLRVLASDEFAEDHCFRLVASSTDTSRIGIGFEPTPQRKGMSEIQGTVWLDRASSELREMQWQYLNIAKDVDETATGGSMHFAKLRNGAWVISRWAIRMPVAERGAGTETNSITFRGVKTVGGELVSASSRSGQDTLWSGPKMTMHGFAYDSLSKRAMTAALIGIAGTNRSTITDSAGRFAFGDLPPGAYRLITQHDALEAVGMPYQSTLALLTSQDDSVTVTMPSFETIWRIACESTPPGKDTALVYGTVRGLGRARPITNATVIATWVDVSYTGKKRFDTKRWHLDEPTDSTGTYVLCGVPTQTGLRMRAVTDSAESGLIDVLPLGERLVERRDLTISYDPNGRGVVVGAVTGRNAAPIGGARIMAEGVPEVRTDAQGKFTLRGVPLGTQQIEVLAVGLQPVSRIVEVSLTDTARADFFVTRPVVLAAVNVIGSAVRQQFVTDFNNRRVKGLGIFRDSTVVSSHGTLNAALAQVQGVRVVRNQIFLPRVTDIKADPNSPGCVPIVWIDGVHVQSTDDLMALRPSDIAAFEIYTRELMVPAQFVVRNSRTPQCGAIVAWTKWYWQGNRSARPPG